MKHLYKQVTITPLLILTLLILTGITLVFPFTTHAQQPASQILRVSPVIIPLSLEPGKVITTTISVENLLDSPLAFRATLSDFDTQDEDGKFVFKDTTTNPLISWTSLSEKDFLLNPHQKKDVTLTITIPQTIPVGGYFEVLFFEPLLPQKTSFETQVATRVGVLLLANIGVTDKKIADILDFSLGGLLHEKELPLLLRVKNTTLQFFTAKPIIGVTPYFGGNEKRITLEDKLIFPGKVRRWEQQVTPNTPPGLYKVTLYLSTGEGHVTQQEQLIVFFPLQKASIVLGIILIFICLIAFRKRLVTAIKILIKNS